MTRTYTPSVLRHLLTERAALQGELVQLNSQAAELQTKLQKARESVRRLKARTEAVDARRQDRVAAVAAFELVLQAEWPQVNATGLNPVQGWAGKYGARGALKKFVLALLQSAAPEPLTSQALVLAVIQRFGCNPQSAEEARRLRDYVTEVLRAAAVRGALHLVAKRRHTLWRWGPRDALGDLQAAARLSNDPYEDAIGVEVAGQRAGGNGG